MATVTEREGLRREVEAFEARLAALGGESDEASEHGVEVLAGAIEDLENWLAAAPVNESPPPQWILIAAGVVAAGASAAAAIASLWFALLAAAALGFLVAEWQRKLASTPARVQRETAMGSFHSRGVAGPTVWEQHPVRDRVAALEAEGTTEIAFQPAGRDIRRELEAFASVVKG